jgi:hypothetical protein
MKRFKFRMICNIACLLILLVIVACEDDCEPGKMRCAKEHYIMICEESNTGAYWTFLKDCDVC